MAYNNVHTYKKLSQKWSAGFQPALQVFGVVLKLAMGLGINWLMEVVYNAKKE